MYLAKHAKTTLLVLSVIYSMYGCAAYPIDDEDGDGSGLGWDATAEGSHHRHLISVCLRMTENIYPTYLQRFAIQKYLDNKKQLDTLM